MPTLDALKESVGIDPTTNDDDLKPSEKSLLKDLEGLLGAEIKSFVTQKATLQSNHAKLFGLLWGQCTPALQSDIKHTQEYKEKRDLRDCLWLMKQLKCLA